MTNALRCSTTAARRRRRRMIDAEPARRGG
jgi:hypothetical protein